MADPSRSRRRAGRRISALPGFRRVLTFGGALALAAAAATAQTAWAAPALAATTPPSPTKTAKDLAHQQYLQQLRFAHQAAARAKAAAEFARAARTTQAIWNRDGRPPQLTVVTPTRVYLLHNGTLQLILQHPTGALSALWLAQNLPNEWASWPSARVVRLNSALVITDGAAMTAQARDVTTLQLVDHAAIWVARGSFALAQVSITSVNPANGNPLPPTDPARPFLRAARGATLTLDNTTVTGLGNASAPDNAGVTWGRGATGHAVAVKVIGGYSGLRLAASTGVSLRQITVTGSAKDGLVLENDAATTLGSVVSEQNGGNGLRLGRGPANRTVTGVTTSGNAGFSLAAANISGLTVDRLTSTADAAGGVELTSCAACTVTSATTLNDRVGVKISRTSSQIAVTHSTFTGGKYGIFVGNQATGVKLTAITVAAAGTYGVDVSGRNVAVSGSTIGSKDIGVRIGPTAAGVSLTAITVNAAARAGIAIAGDNVTVSHSTVQAGEDGIQVYLKPHTILLDSVTVDNTRDAIAIAKGASAVRVVNPVLTGFARNGISNSSVGLVVSNGRLHGGGTALATLTPMSVTGTRIDQVTEGMHVGPGANVSALRISILAEKAGINIAPRGHIVLTDSTVLAPIGIKGDVQYVGKNTVTLPPFPWLGAVAIAAILLGFILEALHATRQPKRKATREVAPEHVLNVA